MAQQVLHAGKVYELRDDCKRDNLAEVQEILVFDRRVGQTKVFPANELRWLEKGELEKELQ